MNADLFTTTLRMRRSLNKLMDKVRDTGAAFDVVFAEYERTHTKEAHQAMMAAHKTAIAALDEYNAEWDRRNVRTLGKMEGTQ